MTTSGSGHGEKLTRLQGKAVAALLSHSTITEAAEAAIVAGEDAGPIQEKIRKQVDVHAEAIRKVAQLQGLVPAFEEDVKQTEAAIDEHIRQRLEQARAIRDSQLESDMSGRGRSMGAAGLAIAGITLPEKSATASLAWCESCRQPIARIADPATIQQPVTGKDFIPASSRLPNNPFLSGAELTCFKCPNCNNKPWAEEDRILVTDGYFLVPNQAEPVKQE